MPPFVSNLLPSEVARLVLGYLEEEGCRASYRTFLGESQHLQEYMNLVEIGYQYPTSIAGQSLTDMLEAYTASKLEECHIAKGSYAALWTKFDILSGQLKRYCVQGRPSIPNSENVDEAGLTSCLAAMERTSRPGGDRVSDVLRRNMSNRQAFNRARGQQRATSLKSCVARRDLKKKGSNQSSTSQTVGANAHSPAAYSDTSQQLRVSTTPQNLPPPSLPDPGSPTMEVDSSEFTHVLPPVTEGPSTVESTSTLSLPIITTSNYSSTGASHKALSASHSQYQTILSALGSSNSVTETRTSDTNTSGAPIATSTGVQAATPVKPMPAASFSHLTPGKDSMASFTSLDTSILGKSPRRKRLPPKRRGLLPVIEPPKPPKPKAVSSQSDNSSESQELDMRQDVIEKLLADTSLHERLGEILAENINKTRCGADTSGQGEPPSAEHKEEETVAQPQPTKEQDQSRSLDDILNNQEASMSSDTIGNIIDMTRTDPAFDALFQMFNVDKHDFIEQEYGIPRPSTMRMSPTSLAAGESNSAFPTVEKSQQQQHPPPSFPSFSREQSEKQQGKSHPQVSHIPDYGMLSNTAAASEVAQSTIVNSSNVSNTPLNLTSQQSILSIPAVQTNSSTILQTSNLSQSLAQMDAHMISATCLDSGNIGGESSTGLPQAIAASLQYTSSQGIRISSVQSGITDATIHSNTYSQSDAVLHDSVSQKKTTTKKSTTTRKKVPMKRQPLAAKKALAKKPTQKPKVACSTKKTGGKLALQVAGMETPHKLIEGASSHWSPGLAALIHMASPNPKGLAANAAASSTQKRKPSTSPTSVSTLSKHPTTSETIVTDSGATYDSTHSCTVASLSGSTTVTNSVKTISSVNPSHQNDARTLPQSGTTLSSIASGGGAAILSGATTFISSVSTLNQNDTRTLPQSGTTLGSLASGGGAAILNGATMSISSVSTLNQSGTRTLPQGGTTLGSIASGGGAAILNGATTSVLGVGATANSGMTQANNTLVIPSSTGELVTYYMVSPGVYSNQPPVQPPLLPANSQGGTMNNSMGAGIGAAPQSLQTTVPTVVPFSTSGQFVPQPWPGTRYFSPNKRIAPKPSGPRPMMAAAGVQHGVPLVVTGGTNAGLPNNTMMTVLNPSQGNQNLQQMGRNATNLQLPPNVFQTGPAVLQPQTGISLGHNVMHPVNNLVQPPASGQVILAGQVADVGQVVVPTASSSVASAPSGAHITGRSPRPNILSKSQKKNTKNSTVNTQTGGYFESPNQTEKGEVLIRNAPQHPKGHIRTLSFDSFGNTSEKHQPQKNQAQRKGQKAQNKKQNPKMSETSKTGQENKQKASVKKPKKKRKEPLTVRQLLRSGSHSEEAQQHKDLPTVDVAGLGLVSQQNLPTVDVTGLGLVNQQTVPTVDVTGLGLVSQQTVEAGGTKTETCEKSGVQGSVPVQTGVVSEALSFNTHTAGVQDLGAEVELGGTPRKRRKIKQAGKDTVFLPGGSVLLDTPPPPPKPTIAPEKGKTNVGAKEVPPPPGMIEFMSSVNLSPAKPCSMSVDIQAMLPSGGHIGSSASTDDSSLKSNTNPSGQALVATSDSQPLCNTATGAASSAQMEKSANSPSLGKKTSGTAKVKKSKETKPKSKKAKLARMDVDKFLAKLHG